MPYSKSWHICPLCEATCGLEITTNGRDVIEVRGDDADPFTEGYICPKGAAIGLLHDDPDRLRNPMIRTGNAWRQAAWDEAFVEIDRQLGRIRAEHGNNAVGVYVGNPTVHNLGLLVYGQALLRALGTRNIFSASTVDQFPKQLACALLFGTGLSVPIPDINRTQYLMILGANPVVSNGSLLTAPNIAERLRRIRRRGGKIVVIDPRRTKTAELADEHHFIRPGTDAYFLLAIINTLFCEDLVHPGRLVTHTAGIETVRELADPFTPEAVADRCAIPARGIRRLAREIANAPSAAVYGRIGTCTQRFGTVASWLPEVIHVLTGNLDREGGAMFTKPAHGPGNTKGKPGVGKGARFGRWVSRVRGLREVFGELPCACLAEEIETPGDGQIRALITVAGNPVLSTPNGARLSRALQSLEFMLSLDVYLNETTRHAHVILPGLTPLETPHYDLAFSQLAIHNYARYSPPLLEKPADAPFEWETVLRLVGVLSGMGPDADIAFLDDMVAMTLVQREADEELSPIHGRDPGEILQALGPKRGPERILDFLLRTGPYGDGFGANPDGLSLERVAAAPRGIDLGPLQPRIPEVLRTPSGKIELAPQLILDDVAGLTTALRSENDVSPFVLIGRRDLRSNNSWMHNLDLLVRGKPRCTLHIHPDDAGRLGLSNGDLARVASRVASIEIPVECTDAIMPGVVSIPHGWGHRDAETRLSVARAKPGVNTNLLADETLLDAPSGTAVLCGIPVTVAKGAARSEAALAAAK